MPAMADRIRKRKNASMATTRTRPVRVRVERVLHYLRLKLGDFGIVR